jgi:hypothetical protein
MPRHTGWIDVVDVWAQSPLTVSKALHGMDGEKAEVPRMPQTIPGLAFPYGINSEVSNCSPCSFDLQRAGIEIAFPCH